MESIKIKIDNSYWEIRKGGGHTYNRRYVGVYWFARECNADWVWISGYENREITGTYRKRENLIVAIESLVKGRKANA